MIETPLDELRLCEILEEMITENNNIDLSKRAIATLGEYLFFVSTQAEGEEDTNTWTVSNSSLHALLYSLDHKDEVMNFYALKAIENISALTSIAELYFSKENFLNSIIDIFLRTNNPDLKTSSIYTISHLIRLNSSLFDKFILKIPLKTFLILFNNEDQKNKQGMLNCLIYGCRAYGAAISKQDIFQDIMQSLIGNFDSSNSFLKMKIILLLCFSITDITSILKFNNLRLFQILLKLRKESQSEIKQAIVFFEHYMTLAINEIIKLFKSLVFSYLSNPNQSNLFVNINTYLNAFCIIVDYPKIANSLFKKEFLERLMDLIENNIILDNGIQSSVIYILTALSENKVAIEDNSDFIVNKFLISILNVCDSIDNKVATLTISANIITNLLDDDRIYSSTVVEEGKTKKINGLIISILPKLRDFLNNNDLIFVVLSFLCMILERNTAFVQYYKTEKILDKILKLIDNSSYTSNLNIIKILIKVVESQHIKFEEITLMHLIDKINLIISNDYEDQSTYTEYVIELLYDLMLKINEEKKALSNRSDLDTVEFKLFIKKIEKVSIHFRLCIKLIGNENSNIQEKACVCLMFILQLLGDTMIESTGVNVRFRSSDIPALLKGFEYSCIKIHKRMIKIFRWIIEYQSK